MRQLKRVLFLIIFSMGWIGMAYAEDAKVIVGLGDSTTAGTPGFDSPREVPPNGRGNEESQYAYWLMKAHPEWKVLNRGVKGQRTDQIFKRFEYDVTKNDPDVVVVLAGVNDLHQGRSVKSVEENLGKIYDAAEAGNIPVIACSVLPYNLASSEVLKRIREVNEWIKSEAQKRNIVFCDTYAAVEDPFRPGKLQSTPDEIHPDVEGYRKMADVLVPALKKLFANQARVRGKA